ncbi:MAG TPA: hypothetical protein VK489_16285 [Ferruginibacter sp.]|nr:hypothetical protein [Ferruginibacter sp.]
MTFISHMLPLLLLVVPVAWGIYGYFKNRTVNKPPSTSLATFSPWPLIINSAVLYALAFNLIFFIQELFLALGKRWLGLKAQLYHNNHNWEGSHPMDSLAQGYGAAAILIVGMICLFIARRMKRSSHWMQLFFLWMAFQGFAQSLPQFITASIAPDTDTGQAFTYLGISKGMGLVVSLLGVIIMLCICVAYSRYLLQLAPNTDFTNHAGKRWGYLFKIAVLAGLIGIILIIPFRIMPWNRALAPVFVTLFSIPMVFASGWAVKNINPVNSKINKKVFIVPIIMLVIVLLVFQFILAKGVEM